MNQSFTPSVAASLYKPIRHAPSLHAAARRARGKRIGLYGGSFNPGHAGHLQLALTALKRLPLDEIWFLVSPGNPHKGGPNGSGMAPYAARLASAAELAARHPKLRAVDIEASLGSARSAETIRALKKWMPRSRFVWLMGADNLRNFHTWWRYDDIVRSLPIAIFDRPGYSVRGFMGPFATRYRTFRQAAGALSEARKPGWAFVRMKRHGASATTIRAKLKHTWHRAEADEKQEL